MQCSRLADLFSSDLQHINLYAFERLTDLYVWQKTTSFK